MDKQLKIHRMKKQEPHFLAAKQHKSRISRNRRSREASKKRKLEHSNISRGFDNRQRQRHLSGNNVAFRSGRVGTQSRENGDRFEKVKPRVGYTSFRQNSHRKRKREFQVKKSAYERSIIDLRNNSQEKLDPPHPKLTSSRQKHSQLRVSRKTKLPKLQLKNASQMATYKISSRRINNSGQNTNSYRRHKSIEPIHKKNNSHKKGFRISKSKDSIHESKTYDPLNLSSERAKEKINTQYAKYNRSQNRASQGQVMSESILNSPSQDVNIVDYNCSNTFVSEDIADNKHGTTNRGYRRSSIMGESQENISNATGESLENAIIIRKHKRKQIKEERKRWLKIQKEKEKRPIMENSVELKDKSKNKSLSEDKQSMEHLVSTSKLSDRTVKKQLTGYNAEVMPIIRICIEEANINAIRIVKKKLREPSRQRNKSRFLKSERFTPSKVIDEESSGMEEKSMSMQVSSKEGESSQRTGVNVHVNLPEKDLSHYVKQCIQQANKNSIEKIEKILEAQQDEYQLKGSPYNSRDLNCAPVFERDMASNESSVALFESYDRNRPCLDLLNEPRVYFNPIIFLPLQFKGFTKNQQPTEGSLEDKAHYGRGQNQRRGTAKFIDISNQRKFDSFKEVSPPKSQREQLNFSPRRSKSRVYTFGKPQYFSGKDSPDMEIRSTVPKRKRYTSFGFEEGSPQFKSPAKVTNGKEQLDAQLVRSEQTTPEPSQKSEKGELKQDSDALLMEEAKAHPKPMIPLLRALFKGKKSPSNNKSKNNSGLKFKLPAEDSSKPDNPFVALLRSSLRKNKSNKQQLQQGDSPTTANKKESSPRVPKQTLPLNGNQENSEESKQSQKKKVDNPFLALLRHSMKNKGANKKKEKNTSKQGSSNQKTTKFDPRRHSIATAGFNFKNNSTPKAQPQQKRSYRESTNYNVKMLNPPKNEDPLVTDFATKIANTFSLEESSDDEDYDIFKEKKITNYKTALFEALFDLKLQVTDNRFNQNRPRVRIVGNRKRRGIKSEEETKDSPGFNKVAIISGLENEMDEAMEQQEKELQYNSSNHSRKMKKKKVDREGNDVEEDSKSKMSVTNSLVDTNSAIDLSKEASKDFKTLKSPGGKTLIRKLGQNMEHMNKRRVSQAVFTTSQIKQQKSNIYENDIHRKSDPVAYFQMHRRSLQDKYAPSPLKKSIILKENDLEQIREAVEVDASSDSEDTSIFNYGKSKTILKSCEDSLDSKRSLREQMKPSPRKTKKGVKINAFEDIEQDYYDIVDRAKTETNRRKLSSNISSTHNNKDSPFSKHKEERDSVFMRKLEYNLDEAAKNVKSHKSGFQRLDMNLSKPDLLKKIEEKRKMNSSMGKVGNHPKDPVENQRFKIVINDSDIDLDQPRAKKKQQTE